MHIISLCTAKQHQFKMFPLASILAILVSFSAFAQSSINGSLLRDGQLVEVSKLETGDQAILENVNDVVSFAGYSLNTNSFTGVLGISSQASYLMTISGAVSTGENVARAGEIMIILPYGQNVSVEKYDAGRFVSAWSNEAKEKHQIIYTNLLEIANQQEKAIFWGRYETTAFNVSAPGSAEMEEARRSIIGAKTIQNIRFSGDMDPSRIEEEVVNSYRHALVNGDAGVVADLTDPDLFGGADLRGNGTGARLLLARNILNEQNWKENLSQSNFERTDNNQIWSLSNDLGVASMRLSLKGDFIYVSNINWQEK